MSLIIRNILYWLGLVLVTVPYSLVALLVLPLPRRVRHRIVTSWVPVMLWWLRQTVGLRFTVLGRENIPTTPAVIASKHQSGWETMALQQVFPPQVFVSKRELMWVPFFGWGLATVSPIWINRSNPVLAGQQLAEQGLARIALGFWISVFPEGTRTAPGTRAPYKMGAARLAQNLKIPLVPVALNSGEFWPRNSFLKYPGEITVVVGPPVTAVGRDTREVMSEVEAWIEARQLEIGGVGPKAAPPQRAARQLRENS